LITLASSIGRGLLRADQHRDILLAVHRIGDWGRVDAGAEIDAPGLFEGFGLIGS
jgi:hypothetical protein